MTSAVDVFAAHEAVVPLYAVEAAWISGCADGAHLILVAASQQSNATLQAANPNAKGSVPKIKSSFGKGCEFFGGAVTF